MLFWYFRTATSVAARIPIPRIVPAATASSTLYPLLAARVGHSSTTETCRFYNSRDHSTVFHAVQRIEALLEAELEVDALSRELKTQVMNEQELASSAAFQRNSTGSSACKKTS